MQRGARATVRLLHYFQRRWPVGAACLCLILAASGTLPAAAQSNNAYRVRDINASITADTGVEAREKAIRGMRDAALLELFRRLTPAAYHRNLPALPPEEVDALVIATDVVSEQVTARAYRGELAITFSQPGVQEVLRRNNLPFTDNVSPPLIVVPVYERAGARQLWETPNPWDSAWRARIGAQGLVRIVMAKGNPSEQLVISADQAVAGDADRLRALAQSYGARGALVAHAVFQINPRNGQPYLETTLTGYGVAPPGPLERTFAGQAGLAGGADQAAAILAETAAAGLWDMLAEAWKAQNVNAGGPAGDSILASYAVTHLGEYASMLRQLREIPSVSHTAVASLTAREVVFRLTLAGSPTQARNTFSQYGLSLTDAGGGTWVLKTGG